MSNSKKLYKQIICGGLVALLCNVGIAHAMDYPDLDYDQAYLPGIMGMTTSGIVQGYEDGTFRPDSYLSRIEALKIILKSASVNVVPMGSTQYIAPAVDSYGQQIKPTVSPLMSPSIAFPDVPLDSWYAPFVNTGEQKEIIHGYPDGMFRPQAYVSRVEAYKMLFRSFGVLLDAPVEGEDWFTPYIKYALDHNLANFGDNPRLDLSNSTALITRAEFTDLAFRLRNISAKIPTSQFSESSYPTVSIDYSDANPDLFGSTTTDKKVTLADRHYLPMSTDAKTYVYTARNYAEAKAIAQAKFKKTINYAGINLAHDNFAAGAYDFSVAVWNSPFEKTGLTYAQWYAMKATTMLQEGYLKDKAL